MGSEQLAQAVGILPYAAILHLIFGIWMYGNSAILESNPYDWMEQQMDKYSEYMEDENEE